MHPQGQQETPQAWWTPRGTLIPSRNRLTCSPESTRSLKFSGRSWRTGGIRPLQSSRRNTHHHSRLLPRGGHLWPRQERRPQYGGEAGSSHASDSGWHTSANCPESLLELLKCLRIASSGLVLDRVVSLYRAGCPEPVQHDDQLDFIRPKGPVGLTSALGQYFVEVPLRSPPSTPLVQTSRSGIG
ncbi:Hypothetical predicted protein [Pelobates cultripes]|uniref:Uncharacterized protein n=1 Tax=Pelobates cultripes TaxID=61616 RepID=A0AAD1S4C8_PELCU|nr:Hypothetical predicted protein [Pelobates cultripes]